MSKGDGAVIHSKSRGIVVFNDRTSLLWEYDDGHVVIQWCEWHDSPKSAHAAQHGGVYFSLVWQLINNEVIYEREA